MSSETEVSAADVRAATLHLIELAAAFEGRGVSLTELPGDAELMEHHGWESLSEREAFDADRDCLVTVTNALNSHRQAQRRRQRDAILERLLHLLTEIYAARHRGDIDDAELRQGIELFCAVHWISASERDLSKLIPRLEEMRGPKGAAKTALEAVVGLGERSLGTIKSNAEPLNDARRPFGRWITRQTRAAYAQELHAEVFSNTSPGMVAFAELREPTEVAGQIQDRRMEAVLLACAGESAVVEAMLPDCLRLQFRAAVEEKLKQVLEEIKSALDGSEPSKLPVALRDAAQAYCDAMALNGQESDEAHSRREDLVVALESTANRRLSKDFVDCILSVTGALDDTPRGVAGKVNALTRTDSRTP